MAIVVNCYRVFHTKALSGVKDVLYFLFVAKLRIVDADDGEIVPLVFVVPFPDPGNHPLAVNSTKGPEFYEHDLASNRCQVEWLFGI